MERPRRARGLPEPGDASGAELLRRAIGGQLRDVLLDERALALLVERRLDEAAGGVDGEVGDLALQLGERLGLLLLDLLPRLGDEVVGLLARARGEVGAQHLHLLARLLREGGRLALGAGE